MGLDQDRRQVIVKAARLARNLVPLTRRLISDEFTAEEREEFRQLVHRTRKGERAHVFDLSNDLNALCGERALKTQRDQESGRLTSWRDET